MEKPFAMAYVRLRLEKGTALPDGEHKLAIFKVARLCKLTFSTGSIFQCSVQVDGKAYNDKDTHYLHLPSMLSGGHSAKRTCTGLTWSPKDSFSIQTIICSTQFTQNGNRFC